MAKQKPAAAAAPPKEPSEYTVVARRYRPRQFADLVGQDPVARALTNAIQSDRVAHAYLFTGVRGTGKTSCARILAKALNCAAGPTATPCDQCEICQSIASGQDVDVVEIDGASNNGVEEIRDLRQNVAMRASRSRYKIYIIDEVHMLTKQAFNALLKTLEEPPPHVKFIFATTEVQKIPLTILSRCQRFDFTGISAAKIAERLKQVVAAEGRQADDDALMLVARRGGGSMRDAQSLLDQLLAFDGEKLTAAKVHQLLGSATDERMLTLVDAIVARDAKLAFELLARFAEEGLQLGELLDQLIEYWRTLMVLNCAGKSFPDISLAESSRDKAYQHAQSLPLDSILAGLDILTTTKNRLRGNNHGLVLLEMTALRLIRLDELAPIGQLVQWLNQPGAATPAIPGKPGAALTVPTAEPAKKNSLTAPESSTNGKVSAGETTLEAIWAKSLELIGPFLGGNLKKAGLPAILGPNSLVIRFESRYTSESDFASEPGSIDEIQKSLKTVTGENWMVRVEQELALVQSEPDAKTQEQPNKPVTYKERSQEALQIPLMSRAVDKLGARLLKMDDGFGTIVVSQPGTEMAEPPES
jgi:DNA polymerase-3 subunit gamma/tau